MGFLFGKLFGRSVFHNGFWEPLKVANGWHNITCDEYPPRQKTQSLLLYTAGTWRIIPVSKCLVTPIYKPFRPFGRGTTPFRGLTNHGY